MPNKNNNKIPRVTAKKPAAKVIRPYTGPGGTVVNQTGNWRTNRPEIDHKKCISCGLCIKLCPEPCISWKKIKKTNKPVVDYRYCKGCGLCAEQCPVKAIKMVKDYR